MSIANVSSVEDVNKTDDLRVSLESNLEEDLEIFDTTNYKMNLKENSNLNESVKSNSNILAMDNEDMLAKKYYSGHWFYFWCYSTVVSSADNGDTIFELNHNNLFKQIFIIELNNFFGGNYLIKKRYFLIIVVCLFTISAVSAEEVSNETNVGVNSYDSGLMAESVDGSNLLTESAGSFSEL